MIGNILKNKKIFLLTGSLFITTLSGCSSNRTLEIHDLSHPGRDISYIRGQMTDGGPADPEILSQTRSERKVLVRVYRGDTLFGIMHRAGANIDMVSKLSSSDKKRLTNLYPNDVIELTIDNDGDVKSLAKTVKGTSDQWIIAEKTRRGYSVSKQSMKATYEERYVQGEIKYNFYEAGRSLNINQSVLRRFVNVMSEKVDLERKAYKGDDFKIAYRQMQLNGRSIGEPVIIAAEYTHNGLIHQAYRYKDSHGNVGFYDHNGKSLKEGFLKSPIKYRRISSSFTKRRWHPVLKRYRAHHGVDLAAPTGTDVLAPGDGTVKFIGNKGGYGKVIEINHSSGIKTIYAHLSRFKGGLRVGDRVNKGDVIAYVGSTGVSTGPHLHYEIRVNNVPVDPMKAKVANVTNLSGNELKRFKSSISKAKDTLGKLKDGRDEEYFTSKWDVTKENSAI